MRRSSLRPLLIVAAAGCVLSILALAVAQTGRGDASTSPDAVAATPVVQPPPAPHATADHRTFEILQQDFPDGPSVTAACLTCHTEAAKQVMKTAHWTWICPRAKKQLEEQQHIAIGKAEHIINNFCIALPSNEPRCTSCHAGYGWEDKTFDFNDETRVDCLVCHDRTGTYRKFPTGAGHPVYRKDYPDGREWPPGSGRTWAPADLTTIAQNVGPPTRHNCGACHFFGGGGEGVKHGDMDVQLDNRRGLPHRSLDVHMASDGANFDCTQCHTTRDHSIAGRCFEIPAYEDREFVLRGLETNLLACEACHTTRPHPERGTTIVNGERRSLTWAEQSRNAKLNDHADKVSCQACHIPAMAREKATVMWWDWSKAGRKDADGKPIVETAELDGETVATYDTKKGEFIWAKNAVPEYVWYANRVKHTFMGDRIDDQTPARDLCEHTHGAYDRIDENEPVVFINRVMTGYDDPKARIWPAKIHRGRQPYDPVNRTLVIPKLFPSGEDAADAYWKSYDWGRSIEAGMAYADLPYSGEYDWIQTEMIWPLKHTVAPKEQSLKCVDCHHPQGRLSTASMASFYMPGRDGSRVIDLIGILLIVGAIAAALVHGGLRILLNRKGNAA
jgi:octaheme c-type cytochrome (tetrathionate reductase family)